jgi:hypothetical protein
VRTIGHRSLPLPLTTALDVTARCLLAEGSDERTRPGPPATGRSRRLFGYVVGVVTERADSCRSRAATEPSICSTPAASIAALEVKRLRVSPALVGDKGCALFSGDDENPPRVIGRPNGGKYDLVPAREATDACGERVLGTLGWSGQRLALQATPASVLARLRYPEPACASNSELIRLVAECSDDGSSAEWFA